MPRIPAHPTLEQLSAALLALAEELRPLAEPHRPVALDPGARWTLTQSIHELKRHLPGYRIFGHPEGAAAALAECQELLAQGHPGAALVSALHGLSAHPHHPELHYAAAAAALENGLVPEAVLLLRHTLWLKPSHSGALEDLGAMFASGALEAVHRGSPDDGDVRPTPVPDEALLRFDTVEYGDGDDFWAAEDSEAA